MLLVTACAVGYPLAVASAENNAEAHVYSYTMARALLPDKIAAVRLSMTSAARSSVIEPSSLS